MAHPVDVAVTRIVRWLRAREIRSPSVNALTALRERARDQTLEAHAPRLAALAGGIAAGDEEARRELGELAERALVEMRQRVKRAASDHGWRARLTAGLHSVWQETDEGEYLDDDQLDRAMRVRLLQHLDALNLVLENYDSFFEAMRPLFRPSGTTRVLDLAAGHGGFALEAARIARKWAIPLKIDASDIKREYLDLGESVAEREQLPVRFVVQNALDLGNVAPDEYDIVTCTQSLHHFGAGASAVMLAEALKKARRGVVFVDGCRSVISGTAVSGLCLLRWGDAAFAHDAMVSFRRFFAPEELGLLARLTPLGRSAEARFLPPGHVLLRAARA